MSESAGSPILHAVLVCRSVEAAPDGAVSLQNVVEIVPAASLPGDVGPICFVAFVRDLPEGPGEGAFVLKDPGGTALGRMPMEVTIPPGFRGRQLALHVQLQTFPVERGGWFHVHFEWNGQDLGDNRFAVGAQRNEGGGA